MITGWHTFFSFTSHLLRRGEKGIVKRDTVAYLFSALAHKYPFLVLGSILIVLILGLLLV